jgi:toxin ParE1/3/4
MSYKVYLIADAEQDILEIYDSISDSDSPEKAEYVYRKIEEKCLNLSELPNRGHFPPELERIGIYEYREIHYKPYRVIYQIIDKKVYIHCILDGRRELQALLEKRLLRS